MIGDKRKNIVKNKRGYSFIEMIVSLGLFSVVFLMVMTFYLTLIESQRSVIATQNIQESMKFVFEIISKEMRSAQKSDNACFWNLPTGYTVPATWTLKKIFNYAERANGDGALYFENKYGDCVFYYLENDGAVSRLKIQRYNTLPLDLFITPNDINVENLGFYIYDDDIGAFHTMQPYVTIRMDVETYGGKQVHKQRTSLQTTISSRRYE